MEPPGALPVAHIDPSTLPRTWEVVTAPHQPIYVNKTTGETIWRPPPEDTAEVYRACPTVATTRAAKREYAVASARIREIERREIGVEVERQRQQAARLSPTYGSAANGARPVGRASSRTPPPTSDSAYARRAACGGRDALDVALTHQSSDGEAEQRGLQRGTAYLAWLHSDIDQRPIKPLHAFKFEFDESLSTLQEQARAEAAAAEAQQSEHELRAEADRQRRIARNIAAPPPKLSSFQTRLWAAFCEVDVEGSQSLSRRQFEAALASVGLVASGSANAASRWRDAQRDRNGRVPWGEFRRVGTQLKALEDVHIQQVAALAAATQDASRQRAAQLIQSRTRGRAARGALRRRSQEDETRRRAHQIYASSRRHGEGGRYGEGGGPPPLAGSVGNASHGQHRSHSSHSPNSSPSAISSTQLVGIPQSHRAASYPPPTSSRPSSRQASPPYHPSYPPSYPASMDTAGRHPSDGHASVSLPQNAYASSGGGVGGGGVGGGGESGGTDGDGGGMDGGAGGAGKGVRTQRSPGWSSRTCSERASRVIDQI